MSKPRRIVLIMTDSQRWDMLNCYRETGLATPNLDRLADEGVRFERAYTCSPVCGPARAGLFTGTWPHSNGSWGNHMPLGDTIQTIGQRLQRNGLQTAYIGKWHLDASDYFGKGSAPEGWDPDVWYDMRNYLDELSDTDKQRSRDVETIQDNIDADFTFGHRCSDRAIDYLKTNADNDFFLTVSYDEPHGPYLCPREYYDKYTDFEFPIDPNVHDSLEDKPEHIKVWAGDRLEEDSSQWKINRPEYFGCNEFIDHEIGRVLEAIDRECPDALVIFTSDHGHMELSHRLYIKGPAMYDEIARIPFIIRWPDHAPAGSVCPHPVSHIDVVPTIMDYCGFTVPATIQGQSILPTYQDPDIRPADTVFSEWGRLEVCQDGYGAFQPIRCAFNGEYKLVINLLDMDELYDIENDPHELVNLIEHPDHTEARNALHDQLLEWMNTTQDPFRGYYWERRPWRQLSQPLIWHYTSMIRQRESEPGEDRMYNYDTGLPCQELTRPVPGAPSELKT